MFDALNTWFQSKTSGSVIMALLAVGTLLYGGARWLARSPERSRLSNALDAAALVALAAAGIVLIVGGPFNE